MIYGNLAIVPRDNWESFLPCGFKENCSALKIYRHCVATKDKSQKQVWLKACLNFVISLPVHEQYFAVQSKEDHKCYCTLIKGDTSGISSKEYRMLSCHVCDGSFIPDFLHDILERTTI